MRLFVAIALPAFAQDKLSSLPTPMDGVTWTPTANYHLTLKFVGETDVVGEERVAEALDAIAITPFILELEGLGLFPDKGPPRVMWVGLRKPPPQLFQLQQKVESALFALGFDPGNRAFTPHVTVARLGTTNPGQIRQFLRLNRRFGTAPFVVDRYFLYSSEAFGRERRYTRRAEFPLLRKSA